MGPRSQTLKNELWPCEDPAEGVEIEKSGNIAGLFAGSVNGYFWFFWPGLLLATLATTLLQLSRLLIFTLLLPSTQKTPGSVVPEQRQQNNDRQRNANQPQQCTSSKAHSNLPSIFRIVKVSPHAPFCSGGAEAGEQKLIFASEMTAPGTKRISDSKQFSVSPDSGVTECSEQNVKLDD